MPGRVRRTFIGVLDERAPDVVRGWVRGAAVAVAAACAAAAWFNGAVAPWSWPERGAELAVVAIALACAAIAPRRPSAAAVLLLGATFAEVHGSALVGGVTGGATVLAPVTVAAAGFVVGGGGAWGGAALSLGLLGAAALVDGVAPGLTPAEGRHLVAVAAANGVSALMTGAALAVLAETARGAEAGRRAMTDLIHHAPEGILTLDGDERIVMANPAAGLLLRQSPATLEGLGIDALPVRPAGVDGDVGLRLEADGAAPLPVDAVGPDGQVRRLLVRARTLPQPGGALHRLVVLRDASAPGGIGEEGAGDVPVSGAGPAPGVDRLARGLAHEFNNIFTVIRGAADLLELEADDDPEAVRESAATILAAGDRGLTLIRQLQSYARPPDRPPETFSPAAEIEGMAPVLQGLAGDDVTLELALESRARVTLDRPGFRETLFHLVTNAREAMADGGRLSISLDDDGAGAPGAVRLRVQDTGEGMPPETRARVFDPFFSTHRDAEHAGLGLTVVQSFVERAGGQVRITSSPGAGTTVHVLLPATVPPAHEGRAGGGEPGAAEGGRP